MNQILTIEAMQNGKEALPNIPITLLLQSHEKEEVELKGEVYQVKY